MYLNKTINFVYTKERRKFGRQCMFSDKSETVIDVPSNNDHLSQHIRKNPVDASTQLSTSSSGSEVNTDNKTYESRGMNHVEGGWPKEIIASDEDQTARYKKRIEREDQYEIQLKRISAALFSTINQNIAVNAYEEYFNELSEINELKDVSIQTIRRFSDPSSSKMHRSANRINFSPNNTDIAVSYADMTYPFLANIDTMSYIWNIEYSQSPKMSLAADSPLTELEYNIREEFLIAGGKSNGCVCVYDTRVGSDPQAESQLEFSHKEAVSSLLWIQSKSNTDFFTGSYDGHVKWWDIRSLSEPTESLLCDSACSELEFNYSMPSKFTVGTVNGFLYYGNRRGATPEDRLPFKIKCHECAIQRIERNPISDKNILTVSGSQFKVWSEDCRDSCIYSSQMFDVPLTCGTWNPKRGSLLLLGKSDGSLCMWDFLFDQKKAVATIQPHIGRMNDVRCHANGNLIASSYASGDVFLLQLCDDMFSISRDERTRVSEHFERETNREKYFLAKIREIKLNLRKKDEVGQDDDETDDDIEVFDPQKAIEKIENDFNSIIEE